ncbi:MAG: hypothetical protein ACI90V_001802 [Bacillariaceae sp.]|jgi:hypothetical protein
MWTTPVQVGISALTTFGHDSVLISISYYKYIVISALDCSIFVLLAITTPLLQKFTTSSASNSASGTAWCKRTSISVSISARSTVEGIF